MGSCKSLPVGNTILVSLPFRNTCQPLSFCPSSLIRRPCYATQLSILDESLLPSQNNQVPLHIFSSPTDIFLVGSMHLQILDLSVKLWHSILVHLHVFSSGIVHHLF